MLKPAKVNREMVKSSVDLYFGLALFYKSFDGPKTHIKFQDLVDEKWQSDNLLKFVEQIIGATPAQSYDFSEILALSRDSQEPMRKDLSSLKCDLSAVVSEFIDYKTVLDLLE